MRTIVTPSTANSASSSSARNRGQLLVAVGAAAEKRLAATRGHGLLSALDHRHCA